MNLEPEFAYLIKICIKKYFPDARIFVFGSRARETNRKFSDIDIAIKSSKITAQLLARARFELEESALPYKVDVVNYYDLDEKILHGAIEI
jgi:predicted nucleotidyltransferase